MLLAPEELGPDAEHRESGASRHELDGGPDEVEAAPGRQVDAGGTAEGSVVAPGEALGPDDDLSAVFAELLDERGELGELGGAPLQVLDPEHQSLAAPVAAGGLEDLAQRGQRKLLAAPQPASQPALAPHEICERAVEPQLHPVGPAMSKRGAGQRPKGPEEGGEEVPDEHEYETHGGRHASILAMRLYRLDAPACGLRPSAGGAGLLRLDAAAYGLRPSAGGAGLLRSAVLAAVLSSVTAQAAKSSPARAAAPSATDVHMIAPGPPTPNAAHDAARRIAGEEAAQEVIDEGVQVPHNAPPPRSLVEAEPTAADPVDLVVYYFILGLITLAGVGILYRYLSFRFSLDTPPLESETEVGDSAGAAAPAESDRALGQRDPRRPVARPAPPAPAAVPAAPAPAPAPAQRPVAPPARAPAPQRRDAPQPPSDEQLVGKAAQILSGRTDWMTVGGIAAALQTDEWTTAKVLESLTDSGRVQEAKAQNGQTVYRYTR